MGILILHNAPSQTAAWHESDGGIQDEVTEVCAGLRAIGAPFKAVAIRRLTDLPRILAAAPGAIVFNLVEALEGDPLDFNLIPSVCRAFGLRCTGAATPNLLLTFDKGAAKRCLGASGIRVPDGAEVPLGALPKSGELPRPPWIVKPLRADGSEGILDDSVTSEPDQVEFLVRRIHDACGGPALVEAFIEGREFGVSLLAGADGVEAMPVAEIDFSLFPEGRPAIVDYAVKWLPGTIPGVVSPRRVPADIPPAMAEEIQDCARRSWHATGCSGYARVDFRMDAGGRLLVMEVNSNPDVSARGAFRAAIAAGGISWPQCLLRILDAAAAGPNAADQ